MKGTILDFLKLAAEKPELAKELVELATKYDFEFTADELSDAELEAVAGGATLEEKLSTVGEDGQLANIDLQNMLQKQQQTIQTLSNVSKMLHDTATAVIRKMS
jgi:hypothetical protein